MDFGTKLKYNFAFRSESKQQSGEMKIFYQLLQSVITASPGFA